jgi:hypothetical protein
MSHRKEKRREEIIDLVQHEIIARYYGPAM